MLPQRRAASRLPLISVISGLSHALDLTEGHPLGHANRSCIIGMRIAQAIGLPIEQQTNLHHALLLKDAGCSSNAQRVHELFGGDDHEVKRAVWLRDWRRFTEQVSYALQYTERHGSLMARLRKLVVLTTKGPRGGGELFRIRCDRGAQIALAMGFPRQTAEAIRSMDEHWDGWGYPDGLRQTAIPIEARIINLAQVAEIFFATGGPALAIETIAKRSGRWFDPELVKVFTRIASPVGFWFALRAEDLIPAVTALQPSPRRWTPMPTPSNGSRWRSPGSSTPSRPTPTNIPRACHRSPRGLASAWASRPISSRGFARWRCCTTSASSPSRTGSSTSAGR